MNIVSFSGGKDSTAMLLMMIENGVHIDRIICVDTTKEFPEMYTHIEKVQAMIDIPIEIVKIDFDYYFGGHIKTKGKNVGCVGYGWPDFRNRWCTALKRQAVKRIYQDFNDDTTEYHGIASDEMGRVLKNKESNRNIRYPLVEWGITEHQALAYCYSKGLDWGGLYSQFNRVSCYCCPLSRIQELRTLYNEFPSLWNALKEMDKLSYRKFRSDYSIKDLEDKFEKEKLLK